MNLIKATLIVFAVVVWIAVSINLANAVAQLPATASTQGFAGPDGSLVIVSTPAPTPTVSSGALAFSDLISGPDTGLGDGNGSGVIVTVWGFGLGSTQGTSTVEYCDSAATCRSGYVYYWKNADGTLPSGPANLYESHGMQEIAFSIPDSATGAGTIKVTVDSVESELPFTVRAGNIYHVKSTGNDSTGDGSFANPWLTVGKATESFKSATLESGSTTYVHDSIATIDNSRDGSRGAIYFNIASSGAGLSNQTGLMAYPNSRPTAEGASGLTNYNTSGQVVSKFDVYGSNCGVDASGQPISCNGGVTFGIQSSADGRAIGNRITDQVGGCADGDQGAISGNKTRVSGFLAFGNEVYDYGCAGSSYQHHTLYFSIRENSTGPTLDPIDVSYNYLHDNEAKNGLHYFDEDLSGGGVTCGQFTGTLKMNNNVVINQGGAGIFHGVRCNFDTAVEFKNNILINTGLKTSWDGVSGNGALGDNNAISLSPGANQTSTITFENNTIIGWNNDNDPNGVNGCLTFNNTSADNININWNGNICSQTANKKFVGSNVSGSQLENNITGGGNVWYTSAGTQTNAVVPSWDATPIITDPLLTITGSQVSVGSGSPIIGIHSSSLSAGIYGTPTTSSAGAVQ